MTPVEIDQVMTTAHEAGEVVWGHGMSSATTGRTWVGQKRSFLHRVSRHEYDNTAYLGHLLSAHGVVGSGGRGQACARVFG